MTGFISKLAEPGSAKAGEGSEAFHTDTGVSGSAPRMRRKLCFDRDLIQRVLLMNLFFVLVWLFLSCATSKRLIMDTPANIEKTVTSVLIGEQLRITADDYQSIQLLLNDKNPRRHLAGIILAGQTKDAFFYPYLFSSALNKNQEIADKAISVILDDVQGFREYLIIVLGSAEFQLRSQILSVLGKIGDKDIVPLLINYFKDPSDDVRNQASLAVYAIADRNDPFLQEALSEPDPLIVSIAYRTLSRYANPSDTPLFINAFTAADPMIQEEAQRAALRLGEAGLPYLHLAAADTKGSLDSRIATLNVMQGLRSPESIETLFALLGEENEKIRTKVTGLLGTYDAEAIPVLIRIYETSSAVNRVNSIQLMGKIGASATLPLLTKALADNSSAAAIAASEALMSFGSEAWPALRMEIDTSTSNSQILALEVLRDSRDPWLIWREPEQINQEGVYLLITKSNNAEIVEYLESINPDVVLKENILSLKEVWNIAEEFTTIEKAQSNEYFLIWRQWEIYSTTADARLKQSFEILHQYFGTRDAQFLNESKELREESNVLKSRAAAQKALLASFPKSTQAEGQSILEHYKSLRTRLVQIWDYTIPEMKPIALAIYSDKRVNPLILERESGILE